MTPSPLFFAELERITSIEENGAADDVMSITIRNATDVPVKIPQELLDLTFVYNDCATELVAARDRGGRDELPVTNQLERDGTILVRLPLDATIEPRSERSVAIRVRHHDLAEHTSNGTLHIDDPLYKLELADGAIPVTHRATVVFPRSTFRRQIEAPGAIEVTSRTARWDWGTASAHGRNLHLTATQSFSPLIGAPRLVDDAIAEVWTLLLKSVVWSWPDVRELRLLLDELGGEFPGLLLLPAEAELVEMSHEFRRDLMTRWLEELLRARARMVNEVGRAPRRLHAGTVRLAEELAREVARRCDGTVLASFPRRTEEALLAVLCYQQKQRERPHSWPADLKEQHFHEHVRDALGDLREVGSNVPTSVGYSDLVLYDTNIELKVADLKGDPAKTIQKFLPQAADYIVSRGDGLGILLILDTHLYSEGRSGVAGVQDQVCVDLHPSQTGASGRSTTVCIITVVVSARLPRPSKLRALKRGGVRPRQAKRVNQ